MKMENKIELTPAELELIRIKREEEKLANERIAIQRKAKEEEEIAKIKKTMDKDLEVSMKLKRALQQLHAELGSRYEFREIPTDKEYHLPRYSPEKEYYFHQTQNLFQYKIVFPESGATITPHEYFGGNWHREYKGIRFKVSIPGSFDSKNDHLKSAKTINEKITSAYDFAVAKKKAIESKKRGIEWLLEAVTETYPQATVTQDQYPHTYDRKHYYEGDKYVKVMFENKLELHYSFKEENGEMKAIRTKVIVGNLSKEDKDKIVNLLIS